MRGFNQVAAAGALLTAVGLLLVLVYQLVLVPAAGISGAGASDPAKVFASISTIQTSALINMALAGVGTLFVVGLYERLHAGAPVLMRIALVPGIVAVALFLANGMINFTALPIVAATYAANTSAGVPLLAVGLVPRGLQLAAVFAIGWFDLLLGWAGLQTHALPQPANYLGLLVGALFILNFLLTPPITLIAPVLGIVWTAWLGVVLWREPASTGAPAMSQA
jgi:hypothetical protein